ncbi:hypothetical protein BD560DRAFT_394853 [Blakeslea trispora]|nr:hypothetical protein BD560DRAFT_394853 [Blakeslea trispora]
MSGNIKVVVRCRPLNAREKARGAVSLVRMEGNQTIITHPRKASGNHSTPLHQGKHKDEEEAKAFTFDRSYWSADKNDPNYADQELVYGDLGRELLDHAFDGYNCCIFAYGQTGSGKSYTMMGYGDDKGITPRTCSELFERIANLSSDKLKFQVEVSYIEIYNEKVRDLLNPANKGNLKVREHPTIGPYVEDLSRLVVKSFEDIEHLMSEGNKARTVAATQMNETSSRSHAVFTLFLTSNRLDETSNLNTEKCSRISLVDLAGSERADSTGATGVRLKEGANINKSLTTLGKVIAALAEASAHPHSKKSSHNQHNFIPYRDSVLTWLLKDSLGGNSKTAMIAAISPADYDETLSTLRYADQAKRIKNKAVVNEDPNARLIRELKEELQALRDTLMIYAPEEVEKITQQKKTKGSTRTSSKAGARLATASPMLLISPESPIATTKRGNSLLTKEQVIEQLQSSEKLLSEVNQTWEEKMSKTEEIHRQREEALRDLGVIVEKNNIGVYAPKSIHLINLNEDPLMTECLMYQIKLGITRVGRLDSKAPADIRLSGPEIMDEHCYFENLPAEGQDGDEENMQRIVKICPGKDSVTLVNGMRLEEPKVLHSGYRIIFGSGLHHLFRFNNPDEVRRERETLAKQSALPSINTSASISPADPGMLLPSANASTVDSSLYPPDLVDWKFAHNEALRKFGNTANTNLTEMTDEDLKQLSEGITKVREFRNRQRISSDNQNILFEDPETISPMTVSPRTSFSSSSNPRFSAISSAQTVLTEDEDDEDDEEEENIEREEKDKLIRIATEKVEQQLEYQKQEYEERIRQISSSSMKVEDIDFERDELAAKYAQMKEEMEKSLKQQRLAYESKIKRIKAHLPPGTALSSDNLMVGFTAKNAAEHLLRISIEKWRQLRYVKMAEGCLVHAVILKEANIMARELGKNIVYQYIVVHDDISSNPLSFWESTSALQPFTREPDTHLIKEPKPCLAVQVIDHVHRATYIWSIAKLKHRLRRMRRLYDYTDKPLFTGQHFNREDPFYETPCPRYSLIGLARIPLRNLTLQLHADNYVDIYCRNTGRVMGQIRVLVTPIARSISRKSQQQQQQQPDLSPNQERPNLFYRKRSTNNVMQERKVLSEKYLLHIGQQQVFEVKIQELKGVSESDFTQVHAQFRLSSFGNVERYSVGDKIYQTEPMSGFGDQAVIFDQSQTLSINITENMMDVILNQGLTVEIYGQAQETYLCQLVEHVSINHQTDSTTSAVPTSEKSTLFEKVVTSEPNDSMDHIPASRRFSADRRFSVERCTFDGILMEERHDVTAWIQILELDSDGDYTPAKILHKEIRDSHHHHIKHHQNIFCLRQGLQRRISLTLSHDSGKQFEWLEIKQVKVGKVQLIDSKGRVVETSSHAPVDIHLLPEYNQVTFERNGLSKLTAQGPWDSSLHNASFLNRITSSGQRIRLALSWQVICAKCVSPLNFEMDIAIQMHHRDATIHISSSSSSLFRQFLMGGDSNVDANRIICKTSSMFMVQLKPPMTRQVRELWRLNTANKYVRGEEFIGSWKPRGVSLITDYREARQQMLKRERVAVFRHALVLAKHPQTKTIQRSLSTNTMEYNESVEAKKTDPDVLLKKVIDLWKTHYGTREEIAFTQDPPAITSLRPSNSSNSVSSASSSTTSISKKYSNMKLIADIQLIHPSDTVTKKGYLLHPENVDDSWLKHWFVLRRPFIFFYKDQTEAEELGVLNLTSARVDYKADLEEMLQRKHIFAIYTNNNAYLFQANDFEDMKDWLSKIDQFYPVKKLESLNTF